MPNRHRVGPVKAGAAAACLLLGFWFLRPGKRPPLPPLASVIHGGARQEPDWAKFNRIIALRKSFRQRLAGHPAPDAARLLKAFDQELSRKGIDAPDLEVRLNQLMDSPG